MNTSNETKTNLTMKGVVTGNPFYSVSVSRVLLVIITLVVFSLLVKLGLWQLSRASFKQEWQSTLLERQQQQALSYEALLAIVKSSEASTTSQPEARLLTGYRLSISAKPANNMMLLLDNQVYQGQVGYLAYQVFEITPEQPWVLVELGFVPASKDRRILPELTPLKNAYYKLVGRIYQKQPNPLSDQLDAEQSADTPIRFQNMNIPALTDLLGHDLAPIVLQPDNVPNYHLPQPWVPIPLSAQKHQGYALQWFTMAAVFLGLMGWIAFRQYRR
ncbi:SURF1 family protein [Shewanella sp. MEBiC00475]|uniref:SURF1 family protein n=1 Tax=Shewanella sp. MEBiC00475 TaxID=2575361 RepID=UPI0010BFA92A|nr:SURF1 family protein [Shewanella sp. MEBiC00475]